LSIILFFQKSRSPYLNNYLLLIFLIIGIRILVNQLLVNPFVPSAHTANTAFIKSPLHLLFLSNLSIFYFYMRSLARGYKRLSWNDLYYFLPMVTVIGINYFLLHFYPQLVVQKNVFNILSFLVIHLFFIFKTLKILKDTIWNRKEINYFANRAFLKKWVVFCFSMFLVLSTKFYTSINFEDFSNNDFQKVNYTLINSLLLLILFIIVLSTPKLLFGLERMRTTLIDHNRRNRVLKFNKLWLKKPKAITNEQHQLLHDRIGNSISSLTAKISVGEFDQNLFRNPDLEISEFAKVLGFPKSHVSILFKYHTTISFIEFRTMVRINLAIIEIDNGYLLKNTMESLASSIGFSSYNPFFTAFKKHTGLSPKKYQILHAKALNTSLSNAFLKV
jgi:AraC-like DNA-binding protein